MFRRKEPLDEPLLHWAPKDAFTFRHLLNSVGIFGRIGSGKSSGSGLAIGRAVVRHPNTGGLILCSKPEDREFWATLIPKGRAVFFGPNDPHCFNFLDFVGDDSRNATNCLLTISEGLGGGGGATGEEGSFWKLNKERTVYCTCEILRLAYGRIESPSIQKFIIGAATDPSKLADEKWQAGFHHQTFKKAHANKKGEIEGFDYDQCAEFFYGEWPRMGEKMRSGIVADVLGVLHPLNSGVTRKLVSTGTTISPALIDRRMWIVVDMNLDEYGDSARVVLGGWKFLTELFILRRHWKPGDAVTPIWCDEAQEVVNSQDMRFLAKCRSHGGCLIFLTQSIHSYFSAMKGKGGESQTKALLTNFGSLVFHQVGDPETAKYASDMLGMQLEVKTGGSQSPGTFGDQLFGQNTFTASFNEGYEPVLQPIYFMRGHKTGGKEFNNKVTGILIRGGTYTWVEFDQRR